MRRILAAAGLAASICAPLPGIGDTVKRTVLGYQDLPGWDGDNHREALDVFMITCDRVSAEGWEGLCEKAAESSDARTFFEGNFTPVLIENDADPLFTGYYEPELNGSRTRTETYRYPLYNPPPDLSRGEPWFSRAEIEGEGRLDGLGLEIAWLADPVDVFFLHVQGSGRLRLTDGTAMRVGFAGKNGHGYRSVGREMARRGLLPEHKVSASAIRHWVRANPEKGREVLWHNPSYIFFTEVTGLPTESGPIGAMSRPVSAMRSVAVDPDFTQLGAPIWVDKTGKAPVRRLMIAQDTGSAIKGPQRADIFYGSGTEAGKWAGRIRDKGRMVVLLPNAVVAKGL